MMALRIFLAALFTWASLAPGVCAVACGDAQTSEIAAMPCHGEEATTEEAPDRPTECCEGEHAFHSFAKYSASDDVHAVVAMIGPVVSWEPRASEPRPIHGVERVLHSPYPRVNPPLLL